MGEEKFVLRTGNVKDAAQLASLAEQSFYEAYSGMMHERDLIAYIKESFTIEKVFEELNTRTNQFTLAFYNGSLAGYSKLDLGLGRTGLVELERLYLLNQYKGLQIGKELMKKCIMETCQRGYEGIWLVVWERNEKAISFYEQWGFRKFDARTMMRGSVEISLILITPFRFKATTLFRDKLTTSFRGKLTT